MSVRRREWRRGGEIREDEGIGACWVRQESGS